MALKEFRINDKPIFIDDEIDIKETGISIKEDDIENTSTIKIIDEKDLLSDTLTDIFGDNNGQ